jgi:SsrA-binding protein
MPQAFPAGASPVALAIMAAREKANLAPRIENRRAWHEYFITHKLECGIALLGTEVKSLRAGRAQLQEAFARADDGQLVLHGCHIEPYDKAGTTGHEPLRPRKLLAHKREIHKLANETQERGTTLIPLAIYFKDGRAKVELGVGKGKQHHDKRQSIKKKEMDREMRKATSRRR